MMILSLIINILALIGALTLALIALALWAFVSDNETYEYYPLIDPFEDMENSIPTMNPSRADIRTRRKEGRN